MCSFIIIIIRIYVFITGAVPVRNAFFGQGSGRIHLDDLGCERSETSIVDCPNNGVNVNNCNHAEDAGVICLGECVLPPHALLLVAMQPPVCVILPGHVMSLCS